MISKELLSKVINKEVFSFFNTVEGDRGQSIRENEITIVLNNGSRTYFNIYELAHKCKIWAYNQGYILKSFYTLKQGYAIIETSTGKDEIIDAKISFTECEAIFKACEWILKRKEINEKK